MDFSFRTNIKLTDNGWRINYSHTLFFIGSCFADSIGSILLSNKHNVVSNPLGVMYNPISVADSIKRILDQRKFTQNDLFMHNNLWHSFALHGSFSSSKPEDVLEKSNEQIEKSHLFLEKCDYLFVTLGTAWIYQNSSNGQIVANCHKLPDWNFTRRKLSVEEIIETWEPLIVQLKKHKPQMKIIFTVSPIRHLKDGAHENQLSKSTLLLAVDELNKINPDSTSYFPSYELIMDELRDYRFYAADMIHLSDMAIDFIYNKFAELYFEADTMALSSRIKKIIQASNHLFLQENKVEIEQFAIRQIKIIEQFEKENSFINFTKEKEHFRKLIPNRCSN